MTPPAPEVDRNVEYFDSVASDYQDWYAGTSARAIGFRLRRARVMALFDQPRGRVLDVGCGPGIFLDDLLKRGCSYWGIDRSPKMIEQCEASFRAKPNVHFQHGTGDTLPFPDASFDAVLCVGVLDRIENDEAVLREMLRVLRVRGTLLVTISNRWSPQLLWRDFAIYPLVELLRRPYSWVTQKSMKPSASHRLYSARAFAERLQAYSCTVAEIAYSGFQILPYPVDRIMPGPAGRISETLEVLSTTAFRTLGAMAVIKAHKQEA